MNTINNYPGNKNIKGVYHKIINNIPKCDLYAEPFAGSGAQPKNRFCHEVRKITTKNN